MSYLQTLLGDAYREGMSEEEISNALEAVNGSVPNEVNRLKTALSKANSEANGYKKQLREKLSLEEQEKIARDEERQNLLDENAQLRRTIDLSNKTNKLLSMGYSEELAISTATAIVDGDFETMFVNQSKFMESQKQQVLAEQLKKTPRPATGSEAGGVDYKAKIEEARASGNMAEMAYYTRLANSETTSD